MVLARRPSFLTLVTLILFAAFVWMRVRELNVRPLHNDEGVNGWFLTRLVRDNDYKYDPYNYHGPSLYYLQLIPTWVNTLIHDGPLDFHFSSTSGITDRSLRSGVIVASLLILAGLFLCRSRVGPLGAFTAFVLLGFSCDFLYFSRYFIHEMFFVLFTLGIYIGAFRYRDERKKSDFALLFLSLTMLFCTKETSIVTMTVMALAWLCAEVTHSLLNRKDSVPLVATIEKDLRWFVGDLFAKHLGILALGVLIWFLLYTSFKPFSNFSGLADSIRTYTKWTREGVESGHNKPFLYWTQTVLIPYEGPITFFSIVGVVMAFLKRDRPGLYLSYWAMGIVGAYSIIPYKTVWCVINLLLPMALLSGYAIQRLYELMAEHWRMRAGPLLIWFVLGVTGISLLQLPQSWIVTYRDYDKEYYEPPYVHTSRDLYRFMDRIRDLAAQAKLDREVPINVYAAFYWPLPFYWRNYSHVGFWGHLLEEGSLDATLIVADRDELPALNKGLKDPYRVEEYTLRPDFPLFLYINKNVFGEDHVPVLPKSPLPPVTSQTLRPGLIRRLYIDRRTDEKPIQESVDFQGIQFEYKKELEKPIKSPFGLRWEGVISIPEDGTYVFALESDDGSFLSIDGYPVVDNDGTHARIRKETSVALKKGPHRFSLRYFDGGGDAVLRATWRKPGQSKEEIIPPNVFFHEEAS